MIIWLVVFRPTPLKNDGQIVSWDDDYGIPNLWKNTKKCSKPPTSINPYSWIDDHSQALTMAHMINLNFLHWPAPRRNFPFHRRFQLIIMVDISAVGVLNQLGTGDRLRLLHSDSWCRKGWFKQQKVAFCFHLTRIGHWPSISWKETSETD